jgi:O-antigen/teichoic acid export membrane protein
MNRAKNFFHGIWSGYAAVGVSSVLNLLTVPVTLAVLGKPAFGLWSAVMQLAAFTSIFDLGLGPSLARFITDFKDHHDARDYAVFLKTVFLVGMLQAVLFGAVAIAVLRFVPGLMSIPAGQGRLFEILALLQLATVALGFPFRPFGQLLYAHQQIARLNGCTVAATVANAAMLLFGLRAGWGIYSCIAGIWASFLTLQAGLIFYVLKLRLLPNLRGAGISFKALQPLAAFAGNVFVIVVGLQLVAFAPTLLVTRKLGLDANADWTIGTKLVLLVWQLVVRTSNSSEPIFWEMFARGELASLRQRLLDVALLVGMAAALLGAGLVAVNAPFVGLWTSGRVHWLTAADLIMAVWAAVSIASVVFNMVPGMTKRLGIMKFVYLFEGVLVAGLAYVPFFYLQTPWQVALVLLLGVSLFRFPYGLYRTCRDLQIPAVVLGKLLGRAGGVALALLAIALVLRQATVHFNPVLQVALNGPAYALVALPLAYQFALPPEPRRRILETLQKILPRRPSAPPGN